MNAVTVRAKWRKRVVVALLALSLALTNLLATPFASSASSSDGSIFSPGEIISDSLFYSSTAMSESEIQGFLSAKIGRCLSSANLCLNVYHGSTDSRPRQVSTKTGTVRCEGFQGGENLAASTLIYRAQVACGISAKVILTVLQKEQALISSDLSNDPPQSALDRAMGMECPDTGQCAASTLGFGNQVYAGTLQLKTYRASAYLLQPGSNFIAYNPDPSCGGSIVNIQNFASAALYNYTPYQPNAAALANMNQAAPPCGSYGIRNFWSTYGSWFGSTIAPDGASAIGAEYTAQGGPTGSVGKATSSVMAISENETGFGQAFLNASIYWNVGVGAKTVRAGKLLDYYFARGGASGSMGWPQLNQGPIVQNGGGVAQLFTGGSLYSSASGTFLVTDPLRDGYFAHSGASGDLGFPTTDQSCAGTAIYCSQAFQEGTVYWSATTGTNSISKTEASDYLDAGGPAGPWGLPVSDSISISENGGGHGQVFEHGSVYVTGAHKSFFVSGGIRDFYFALGGAAGSLGFPISPSQCSSDTCTQAFELGTIEWDPVTGGRLSWPEFNAAHTRLGQAIGSQLGSIIHYPFHGGGTAAAYTEGAIYRKASSGAFGVLAGPIRDAYFAQEGVAGNFGWPIEDTRCGLPDGGCSQRFEGATLFWSASTGAFASYGTFATTFALEGGPGSKWGWPTSPVMKIVENGGGAGQAFSGGSAFANGGGAAVFVSGGIRDFYFRQGGAAGPLGFPIGAASCVASGDCSQSFSNGTVEWNPAAGGRIN